MKQPLRSLLFVLVWLECAVAWAALDRPAGLEPDITFWRRVYTEITTREGFVHDDRRLDIVYETVRLPAGTSDKARRARARAAADKYATILAKLASGKRTGLDSEAARVLALWGEKVDNATLREASSRVRFQLGQADKFKEGLIRSGAWEQFIARTLTEAGVPQEIGVLPHVESSFNPKARSHVGAAGMWQFMPSTGRRYLRIDHIVDERLDPYRSSEAAALLMRHNHEVTESWPLAITAYNHGAAGMRRAVAQLGTRDVERIARKYKSRSFGFASRNFYVAFLAALDVTREPERYFGELARDPPDPSHVVVLERFVPASELMRAFDTDRMTLSQWNPSLMPAVWNGTKHIPKGFALRVPPRDGLDAGMLLASIRADAWSDEQTPDLFHIVQRGETLSSIAPRYGARVMEIAAINGLKSQHRIRVGQRLILPAAVAQSPAVVDDGVYSERAEERIAADTAPVTEAVAVVAAELALAETKAPAAPAEIVESARAAEAVPVEVVPELKADPSDYSVAEDGTIRIQDEESLGHIADWLGVRANTLRRLNGLGSKSVIRVGSRLVVDLSKTSREEFEQRRIAYHQVLQEDFFSRHRIAGTNEHVVRAGESVWVLAERRYNVPVWLLRQYNPDIDLSRVKPGARVVIPVLESTQTADS